MTGASVFIDSNVALYARDDKQIEKSRIADSWLRSLLARKCGRTNLQVLNEVTHVLLRKRATLTVEQIFDEVDGLSVFGSSPITPSIVADARNIRLASRYSWWDCLLLSSALDLGCSHFLSEDLRTVGPSPMRDEP